VRPEGKELGTTALFLKDVHFWQDYFKPRNITPLMWGDMLLARDESSDAAANAKTPEEAKTRRDGIDRNTIIADWHYQVAKPDRYKSLKLFHDEGFKTIACAWSNPENVYSLAQAARLYGAWGTLQTTWAGYSITAHTATRNLDHSARTSSPRNTRGAPTVPSRRPYRGAPPTSTSVTWPRRSGNGSSRTQDSSSICPPSRPSRSGRISTRACAIAWRASPLRPPRGAMALGGALLPDRPPTAQIQCDIAATELAFLQTCAFPAEPTQPVATIEIRFADGTTDKFSLVYGKQTHAWDDPAGPTVVRWTNPHPDQRISRVSVSTEHPYASFALLGVTGLK
jgi:hypothetical protein